ncbi:MAG: hypothetical protein K0S23_353 [Fluviicola sp.]|jgi:hypothetical protein|uniref:DUF3667 domain-containing protein n=1 Tax=Fluviicola sp. TaxID=1917219 RepID=UPI002616A24C|nr:DUF3667 domain-containing protein [Fluviicola sp.]MDF3026046.1 hypothetical protein [Fluviicola sp.]
MTKCSNCKNPISNNFCGYCGQAAELKRINGRYILHELNHVLHFEKGILFTIKSLLINPGQSVRTFIFENRNKLVKPVIFIVITSLIYTIISHWFHVEEDRTPAEKSILSDIGVILEWLQHHYGYANLIMGVFITLWLKLFFRKHNYNFYEVLILLCFVMGIGMLLLAVSAFIEGVSGFHQLAWLTQGLSVIYSAWAIGEFYNKSKFTTYLKALGAYLLGMLSYWILIIVLCITVIIIKH